MPIRAEKLKEASQYQLDLEHFVSNFNGVNCFVPRVDISEQSQILFTGSLNSAFLGKLTRTGFKIHKIETGEFDGYQGKLILKSFDRRY